MENKVRRCLTNKTTDDWRIRRIWVKPIGELLQAALPPPSNTQEGKIMYLYEESVISEMTHITAKTSHSGEPSSSDSLLSDSSLSNQDPINLDPKNNEATHSSFSEKFKSLHHNKTKKVTENKKEKPKKL